MQSMHSIQYFANEINNYLRLKCRVVWREFLTLNAYYLNSSYQIWVRFSFAYQKSIKPTFKTGFWVQNHLLNLCSRVVNLQKLFCSQKTGVKCFVLNLSGKQIFFSEKFFNLLEMGVKGERIQTRSVTHFYIPMTINVVTCRTQIM